MSVYYKQRIIRSDEWSSSYQRLREGSVISVHESNIFSQSYKNNDDRCRYLRWFFFTYIFNKISNALLIIIISLKVFKILYHVIQRKLGHNFKVRLLILLNSAEMFFAILWDYSLWLFIFRLFFYFINLSSNYSLRSAFASLEATTINHIKNKW